MKKKLLVLAIVFVLSSSIAAPVFAGSWYPRNYPAAQESYQGGTWRHSYTQSGPTLNDYKMHYSYYIHPSKGSIVKVELEHTNKFRSYQSVPVYPNQWSQVNAESFQGKNILWVVYYMNV